MNNTCTRCDAGLQQTVPDEVWACTLAESQHRLRDVSHSNHGSMLAFGQPGRGSTSQGRWRFNAGLWCGWQGQGPCAGRAMREYTHSRAAHLAAEQSQPISVCLASAVQRPGPEPEDSGVHGQHDDGAQQPLHTCLRSCTRSSAAPYQPCTGRFPVPRRSKTIVLLLRLPGLTGGRSSGCRITFEAGRGRFYFIVE